MYVLDAYLQGLLFIIEHDSTKHAISYSRTFLMCEIEPYDLRKRFRGRVSATAACTQRGSRASAASCLVSSGPALRPRSLPSNIPPPPDKAQITQLRLLDTTVTTRHLTT